MQKHGPGVSQFEETLQLLYGADAGTQAMVQSVECSINAQALF